MTGKAPLPPDGRGRQRTIVANFRSAHAFALNAAQNGLRSRVRTATGIQNPVVSQRLKEHDSIVAKLVRGAPRAQLSTMQDVGGVRAVLPDTAAVLAVAAQFRRTAVGRIVGVDDYVTNPQRSGYRAIHVVVEYDGYRGDGPFPIEVQLRSKYQHEWAMQVEAWGQRTGHPLKQATGPEVYLEYLHTLSVVYEHLEAGTEPADQVLSTLVEQRDAAEARFRRDQR